MKNVACLFVKFQSWKWAGLSENAHESVLWSVGDKYVLFLPKVLVKLKFLHSKRFFQDSVVP